MRVAIEKECFQTQKEVSLDFSRSISVRYLEAYQTERQPV